MKPADNVSPPLRPKPEAAAGARGVIQKGEPIAIIGMACRFPGAENLEAFWKLLMEGGNSVTEGDPGSGVGRVGEIISESGAQQEACRFGAFVDDIDQFDACVLQDFAGGS